MFNLFVILLGMGTVFVGLICLVFLCMAMSWVIRKFSKNGDGQTEEAEAQNTTTAPAPTAPIKDRQAIIAGVCACIAEELGTEVNNIKVVSFKRI